MTRRTAAIALALSVSPVCSSFAQQHSIRFGEFYTVAGVLYFFQRDNAEVLVKVLDGCGVNDRRWVFVAPVTDLGLRLRVTAPDGTRWDYENRVGSVAVPRSDTNAFVCR